MMCNRNLIMVVMILLFVRIAQAQTTTLQQNPDSVNFHTEDIHTFWKVFDKAAPDFNPKLLQSEYIDVGSIGLRGFINHRIESGKNLSKVIKGNLAYYKSVRESSLSIDQKRDRFYACFRKLKEIYPAATFPDVYFVIGAKNSGGTISNNGLIIGAEMFGDPAAEPKPVIDINYVDEVVAHELIHFQQKYSPSKWLLAQCIREGSADFICELIAGAHSNGYMHEYGNAHEKELWTEFVTVKHSTEWTNWLYYQKDKNRPRDLGYWVGYRICKSYYDKAEDKTKAIADILTITDYDAFLEKSGYAGE